MQVYEDVDAVQPLIEDLVKKFGFAAEHNFWWYSYYREPGQKSIFVTSEHGGLFTIYTDSDRESFVVFDPVAAPAARIPLLMEYIEWMFSHTNVEKIWFQLERPYRREFLRELPEDYRSRRIYFTLTWPVYDLREFDPALPGGRYKTLRKEMHKFYREHQVSVTDARGYADKKVLHTIVDSWKKKRPNRERGQVGEYHLMIDGDFKGCDEARVFLVDGRAAGFNAGWMIPNSDRFYGAVGIHDYSIEDLGSMLYLEDLVWLKDHGYGEVDMAGSEKSLLSFKNKFCLPKNTYQTVTFSVVKCTEKGLE